MNNEQESEIRISDKKEIQDGKKHHPDLRNPDHHRGRKKGHMLKRCRHFLWGGIEGGAGII